MPPECPHCGTYLTEYGPCPCCGGDPKKAIRALESKLAEAEKEREDQGTLYEEATLSYQRMTKERDSLRAEVERLRGELATSEEWGQGWKDANNEALDAVQEADRAKAESQTAHSEACDRIQALEGILAEVDNRCIDIGADLQTEACDRVKELEGALHQLWISCAVREVPHGKLRPSDPMPYSWQKPSAADLVPIWRLVAALRPAPRQEEESDGS